MEYHYNELDPIAFQRLVTDILVARYGDNVRAMPLRGADGGRDAETAVGNYYCEFRADDQTSQLGATSLKNGRYLFQVKHHRTLDTRLSDARKIVLSEFSEELQTNVLPRTRDEAVNYFFLITNVPSSIDSVSKVDSVRRKLTSGRPNLHVDIWWQEQITAFLDGMPALWFSFPELFAGRKPPVIAGVVARTDSQIANVVRLAIERQYKRDTDVRFSEVEFEKSLAKVFVELDLVISNVSAEEHAELLWAYSTKKRNHTEGFVKSQNELVSNTYPRHLDFGNSPVRALALLLDEDISCTKKTVIEGGPGQGKSTLTQMLAQIYRQMMLGRKDFQPEGRWDVPQKARLPFRIELRRFAEWSDTNPNGSVEEYLAELLKLDSGGRTISVDSIHEIAEGSPILLIFDGLDEVGSDQLRDDVLRRISDCVDRLELSLRSDLKVIVTTRPPAISGRREYLSSYGQHRITPLDGNRIEEYLSRWLDVQIDNRDDKERIRTSFYARLREPYVRALAENPMQLAVLLNFIRLRSDAFPDRRAELYREYFQIVINRDVNKSESLRKQREVIETLHQFLAFRIHILTEARHADGSLPRQQLLQITQEWLKRQNSDSVSAEELFELGQERLGLIGTLKGEGTDERHGFAIQPVREYFAAAFVNEQVEGAANDVFQEMVTRPYWREVALFLAGLRRNNEKADLVTRAIELDRSEELGWRQHGRSIVKQLLLEGVLTQPDRVFSLSLEFLMELLDPERVPAQLWSRDTLPQLAKIIDRSNSSFAIERIKTWLSRYRAIEDEYVLERVYVTAANIPQLGAYLSDFVFNSVENQSSTAKMRLLWPSVNHVHLQMPNSPESLCCGLSDELVIDAIWEAAIESDAARGIKLPSRFHRCLVDQFARAPLGYEVHGRVFPFNEHLSRATGDPVWAIWHMQAQYWALVMSTWRIHITGYRFSNPQVSGGSRTDNLSYVGLDGEYASLVSEMITVLDTVLEAVKLSEEHVIKACLAVFPILRNRLDLGGILGWVACRCSMCVLGATLASIAVTRALVRPLDQSVEEYSELNPVFGEFWNELTPFFALGAAAAENDAKIAGNFPLRLVRSLQTPEYFHAAPKGIRFDTHGSVESIAEILLNAIRNETPLPITWLALTRLSGTTAAELVACRDIELSVLLQSIGKLRLRIIENAKPMRTSDMNRVLKIARQTDDLHVLSGAAAVLSSSNYVRSAGPDLILKFLKYTYSRREVEDALFSVPGGVPSQRPDDGTSTLAQVSTYILKHPKEFRLSVVEAAARYTAESVPLNLPPLLSLAEGLRLY